MINIHSHQMPFHMQMKRLCHAHQLAQVQACRHLHCTNVPECTYIFFDLLGSLFSRMLNAWKFVSEGVRQQQHCKKKGLAHDR